MTRFSDAPQPLDPHDPENILAANNASNSSGNGTYKPVDPNPPAPSMQHSNSYNMVPVQPYSPGITPNAEQQRLSGGAFPGPYPSYQQPYGQA